MLRVGDSPLNHWVQATPDYACVLSLNQRSGTPDPKALGILARSALLLFAVW